MVFACFPFHAFCTISLCTFLHGEVSACINMSCAVLQYILHLQPFALGFVFSFSSPPPPHSATCACRVVVLPLHAFRCSICFRWHRLHSISVCTVSMPRRFSSLRTSYRLLGWVTFVHHSVKQHVRRLPALGYDSLEYFIFYIPFEYIGFGQIVLANTPYIHV